MGSSHKPAEVVYLFVLLGDAFMAAQGCVPQREEASPFKFVWTYV